MIADKITYCDNPGCRVLDLRADGVSCIPVLRFNDFHSVRQGPNFHYHPNCMEFCLCLKGNLVFDTPDNEYPFKPGNVFASAPHELHHLRSNPSGLKVCSILFKIPKPGQRILGLDKRGSEWIARSLTYLPRRLFAATQDVASAFKRLFYIYDNADRKSPSRRVRMRAAATDLLIALIDAAQRTPMKASCKISEIARRIRDTPDADYPIRSLARECHVAVSTFANDFKLASGLPLHTYLLNCRINKAKKLLLNSTRTVTSIGHELRFYSAQHFAKTFKRIIGVNPQEYRLKHQGKGGGEDGEA